MGKLICLPKKSAKTSILAGVLNKKNTTNVFFTDHDLTRGSDQENIENSRVG